MNSEKFEEAIKDCSAALELNPKSEPGYANRAASYLKLSNLNAAFTDYESVIKLVPTNAEHHYSLGYVLLNLGRFDEAVRSFSKAIELRPFATAYFYRAAAYAKLDKPDLELADYGKVIELEPNKAVHYNNRAAFYAKRKKISEALADLNRAIEIEPKSAMLYRNRASIYKLNKEVEKAKADEKTAVELEASPTK